jgi:hypothetical protein
MSNLSEVDIKMNEYYKLKNNYENTLNDLKKKILNNNQLSKKEKRQEFLSLKPKCINCKRPGGTIFKNLFEKNRILTATCGIINNPCNLDLRIQLGTYIPFKSVLEDLEKEIKETKNKIIDFKNKQLFDFISSEEALDGFNKFKDEINESLLLYETYLDEYLNITDNKNINSQIIIHQEDLYSTIQSLNESILKFDETNDINFINDAVDIYIDSISVLVNDIRNLKFKESYVWFQEESNTFHLIQKKNSLEQLQIDVTGDKIIKFEMGNPKFKENKTVISKQEKTNKKQIEKKGKLFSVKNKEIVWKENEYQRIWDKFNPILKDILKKDTNWMINFVTSCSEARKQNLSCQFINSPNLIIPPNIENEDDQNYYNFGVEIYNVVFNKLENSHKQTLLTLFSEKNGIKNYNMLEEALANLVSKELKFDDSNQYV